MAGVASAQPRRLSSLLGSFSPQSLIYILHPLCAYRLPLAAVRLIAAPRAMLGLCGFSRSIVDAAAESERVRLPGLDQLKWRTDVAIATSSLKRALK